MATTKWRCIVCNEVFEGDEPPVPCPVCGSGADAFEQIGNKKTKQWRCMICNEVFEGDTPPDLCPVCGASSSAFTEVAEQESQFTKNSSEKFVIIGGGVAGLECAKAIRARNSDCQITMVCGEGVLPYNRPALSDVLEDGMSFPSILLQEEDWYRQNKIDLVMGNPATSIDRYGKLVHLANEDFLPYDKLALATGAKAFCPVPASNGGIPVFTLRSYQDVVQILEKANSSQRAVVVGGGILGLEAAIALQEHNLKITVVELADTILSAQADRYASEIIKENLEKKGMAIKNGLSVTGVTATGVQLSDQSSLEADFVLVSAGIRSETTLAQQCGLNVNRGIVVDSTMKTNDPNIFAMGDCAEFEGKTLGLWSTASVQGQTAGAAMAGDTIAYVPIPPATVFEGASISLFSVGNVRVKFSKEISYFDRYQRVYKNLIFDHRQLAGVVLLGDISNSAKAISAVAAGCGKKEALELI